MSRVSKKETHSIFVDSPPPTTKIIWALLALIQVVCPLLFFTNLTRNPYYTQIALLNVGVALCGALWVVHVWTRGEWNLPRFAFEWPMLVFLSVALVSSVYSWMVHQALRPGIGYETLRIWVFTLVNCVMALYLPPLFTRSVGQSQRTLSIWVDIVLSLLWGMMWFGFHANKDPDPTALIWDSYGGILWALAILYVLIRTRHGEAAEFFHVIFSVSIVAGIYGILQYWGRDIIWGSPIQPYGGRPVSTFGNPNFLSSYMLMVSPLALACGLSSSGKQAAGYFVVSLVAGVSVLCTLTRSSYVGLLAAYVVMGLALIRFENTVLLKRILIGCGIFLLLIFLFPKTPVSQLQSPLLRFTEIFSAIKSGQSYGPWHQRILIWSSAWDMLKQNYFLGNGWGCFELFYPFFQGKYLFVPLLAQFRTHANNAHNVLLEIWSQTGFLGMGAGLWLFFTMVVSGWLVVRNETEGRGRAVSAGLLGGIIGMVVDNFFGNVSIFFAMPAFLFWWNVGALTHESRASHVDTRPIGDLFGRPALIFFMVFCLASMGYYFKRWKQELFYFEGFKQAKVGDVVKSYKALETAYDWFAGEVNCNYELGNSYARYAKLLADKGLQEEAVKYQKKSIDAYVASLHANPGYDEIYFNLGVTQSQSGQKIEAQVNLETSIFINPLLRDAYGALGNLNIQLGELDKAVAVFSQAVAAFPKDKDLWNNLGYCYSQQKDHVKSFEAYKKAVLLDPAFNQAWQNLGVASNALGRHDDPILQVPGLIHQLEAGIAQKDFHAALAPAERVVKILPDSADAQLSLGNVLFYMQQKDRSETAFKRAIELRPTFVIAHVNLGRLYQVSGDTSRARQKFLDALGLDPNDKEAQEALNSLPK